MEFHARAQEKKKCSVGTFAAYCDEGEVATAQGYLCADARQIKMDLHRSFCSILDIDAQLESEIEATKESLRRVLFCYVVRHASLDLDLSDDRRNFSPPIYVQGMNFIAAMLLVRVNFHEEDAFWLLCFVLEDVMDPMFFCAAPKALLGYVATATLLKRRAAKVCKWTQRIGADNFNTVLDFLLQRWLFTMFVNCLPTSVLDLFWFQLVHSGSTRTWFAWTIGLLAYSELKVTENLVDAVDVFAAIRNATTNLDDLDTLATCVFNSLEDMPFPSSLQSELALAKQQLAYVDPYDSTNYLRTLAQMTHFDASEIVQLEAEFLRLSDNLEGADSCVGVDKGKFFNVVNHVSPSFPEEIVLALFDLLDEFSTCNQLSFKELLVGMSILSRGAMDEKLRLAFDLFDSRRRGLLSLAEMSDLCTLLFRLECAKSRSPAYSDSETWSSRRSSFPKDSFNFDTRSLTTCSDWCDRSASADGIAKAQETPDACRLACPLTGQPLSRAFLSKLLMTTRTQNGCARPHHVVDYDGFRQAALSEPRLLDVFSWCLPRQPQESDLIHLLPFDERPPPQIRCHRGKIALRRMYTRIRRRARQFRRLVCDICK